MHLVFFYFGLFFALSPLLTAQKLKISRKWKTNLAVLSVYRSVLFLRYGAWWMHLLLFIFGYFLPFYPPNSPKTGKFKKWKKHLEILSFNTSGPKIMITCDTVLEIQHMTSVIVIFHFGLFFALLPAKQPKNWKFQKNRWHYSEKFKTIWENCLLLQFLQPIVKKSFFFLKKKLGQRIGAQDQKMGKFSAICNFGNIASINLKFF